DRAHEGVGIFGGILRGEDPGTDPLREEDSTGRDAQQDDVLRALVPFEDLVGNAREGPRNITFREQFGSGVHPAPPSPPHGTGLKVRCRDLTLPPPRPPPRRRATLFP